MARTTKKRATSKSSVKRLLIVGLALVVVASGVSWALSRHTNSNATPATPTRKKPGTYVNLNPPTADEKKASDDAKAAIAQRESQNAAISTSGKKSVSPTIVHADGSGVSAYVGNILEDGGTCTATFTKDSIVKTFTSQASANVSYTTCGSMPVSGLTPGAWQLIVSYSSSTSAGSSQPQTVNI